MLYLLNNHLSLLNSLALIVSDFSQAIGCFIILNSWKRRWYSRTLTNDPTAINLILVKSVRKNTLCEKLFGLSIQEGTLGHALGSPHCFFHLNDLKLRWQRIEHRAAAGAVLGLPRGTTLGTKRLLVGLPHASSINTSQTICHFLREARILSYKQ